MPPCCQPEECPGTNDLPGGNPHVSPRLGQSYGVAFAILVIGGVAYFLRSMELDNRARNQRRLVASRIVGHAPRWPLTTGEGEPVVVGSGAGPTVVLIGEPSCRPCRNALRTISEALAKRQPSDPEPELWLVGLGSGWSTMEGSGAPRVVRRLRAMEPGVIMTELGSPGTPIILRFDSSGVVKAVAIGYSRSLRQSLVSILF